jgi:uncharacterized protein involved in outer membrane biogenesis
MPDRNTLRQAARLGDSAGPMRRRMRIALLGLAAFAAALAGAAAAFLAGLDVSGEFLRAPLERALTAAFGVPTRLEGPLRLHTGSSATVSADALVLADPAGAPGAVLARGLRPAARIDLFALLHGAVAIEDVTGEHLELTLVRRADGKANWAPVFAASPGDGRSAFTWAGIARLRIGSVAGSYRHEGAAAVPFEIADLEGALPLRERTAARGQWRVGGEPLAFDLRFASLADLAGPGDASPVQGTLQWAGVRVTIDGTHARDGSRLDMDVHASADDASLLLAALDIPANAPGALDLRMRLGVTATQASAHDLALTLGRSVASGRASLAWAGPRLQLTVDLAADRVDLDPFHIVASLPRDKTVPQAVLELLERASAADADVKLAVGELVGLPVTAQDLSLQGRSGDGVVAASGNALLSGTPVEAGLDYDGRKPRRVLAARLDGGATSTTRLPPGARPTGMSASATVLRGQLRAEGPDARALIASMQGRLDARGLRWAIARRGGTSLSGRFDRLRVAAGGSRAVSADASGRLGDTTCSLKLSGGTLAALLEGTPWPLQVAGACPGETLSAKGRLTLVRRQLAGELAFDAAADRIGAVARALGVAPTVPRPIAARGRLTFDERVARARLAVVRLGRTAGSGEVTFPLDAEGAPRVQLALTMADLDEFGVPADPAPRSADRPGRTVFDQDIRVPDIDFDVAADRVAMAGTRLRRLQFAGAVRSRKMPPAALRFEWQGMAFGGRLGADFSGAMPRLQLDGSAQDVDLRALTSRLGLQGVRLRAGSITLSAQAAGTQLGELLAATTLGVTVDRGRLDVSPGTAAERSVRSEFSATLAAAPGTPTTFAARGQADGEPLDLALETAGVLALSRADTAIPVAARVALGDARLEATGSVARNGRGEGRLQLSGGRLDRLGDLLGIALPEAGPYAASGRLVVSADTLQGTDLDLRLGRSRVAGDLRVERPRAGPPRIRAVLRVPLLHLEDLGAEHWLDGTRRPAPDAARQTTVARQAQAGLGRAFELVRAADLDATIDLEAVFGADELFGGGRVRATANAGVGRLQLVDVRAAGGSLQADLRADAAASPPRVVLRAQARDLEYGALARAMDPKSTVAGTLDLAADLVMQGQPDELLSALGGTVDVAVYPRGLHSDGLALWGGGVLDAILRQLDPPSRSAIDCAVTSLDVAGGVATSTVLMADTPRVRIVGEVESDLRTGALSGRIWPTSKQPRLLSVAPTMLLAGTLDRPRLSGDPGNVVVVPLRMAGSWADFAFGWLRAGDRRAQGTAGCRQAFERILQDRDGAAGTSSR